MVAPASRNASSLMNDASPAPDWTSTSTPSAISAAMACGVRATRVSPGAVSRGTAIFIGWFPWVTHTANRRSVRRLAVREARV